MIPRISRFKEIASQMTPAMEACAQFKENAILMGICSGSVESQYRSPNAVSFSELAQQNKEKEEKQRQDQAFITLLAQLQSNLANLEAAIARDYGENFAEDLLSDLHAKGLVDDEEFKQIMAIEDDQDRRQEIAKFVQENLDSGEITTDDLKDHTWVVRTEWLKTHTSVNAARDDVAKVIVDNNQSLKGFDKHVANKVAEIKAQNGENIDDVKEHNLEKGEVFAAQTATVSVDDFSF